MDEKEVSFLEHSEKSLRIIKDSDGETSLIEISGYALSFNFNFEVINTIEKLDDALITLIHELRVDAVEQLLKSQK